MVIAPTRELAYQIHEQFECYSRIFSLYSTLLIGGNKILENGAFDNNPYIVICTPGRITAIFDLYSEDELKLKFQNLKFLVLDEADMFLYGNSDTNRNLKRILSVLPDSSQRRLVMTTATYSSRLQEFTEKHIALGKMCLVATEIRKIPENINHNYIYIPHQRYKLATLFYIL